MIVTLTGYLCIAPEAASTATPNILPKTMFPNVMP